MSLARAVERIWYDDGAGPRLARAVLRPASALFDAVSAARNRAYDAGLLRTVPLALPAISVGNLSVGGTGKTPVASFVAAELRRRGARPAIVLRGYGDDEPAVHRLLLPGTPVVADADRVRGAARARDEGADVVVLDDAFQHRRARRDADVVLVSADRWHPAMRPLPGGPLRESPHALRRASLVMVTRKAARDDVVASVLEWVRRHVPQAPSAVARLAPVGLVAWGSGEHRPVDALAGARVRAIAAIGDPAAFARQLEEAGARVELHAFDDHRAYDRGDAERLAGGSPDTLVVCTLKDAVKLGPLWPQGGPTLWYLSQDVILERGRAVVDAALDRVLARRGA